MMSKRFFLLFVLSVFIAVVAATMQQKAVFAGGIAENTEGPYKSMSIALIFPDNASHAVMYAKDYNRKIGAEVIDVNALFSELTAAFQRNFKGSFELTRWTR
jgi:hypothetical protein